jgi:hypothetical protein
VPVGKTLVIAASVDCGGAALKIESAGTVLIPTGVTVAGATITLGGETSGDVTPPQPNLVISGAFGGVITGGANDYNEDERWSRLIVPGQGINMTLGNNDSITLDAEGWISWKSKYSLTKDIEVPATAKYDFTGFSTTLSEMSLVANGVTLTIQKGAKIKGAKMWFTGIPDSVSDELENGAKYTYTIKLTHDGRVAFQVPKTVDVIDENGNEYITS